MEISLFVCGFNARLVHYCCDQRYVERSLGGTDSAALFAGKAVHGQLFAGTKAYFESYLLFWSAGTIAISVSGCLDC